VTRERLAEARDGGDGAKLVSAIVEARTVHVHPDHPLEVVLQRLGQSAGVLPVVSRMDVRKLEGVVTVDSIVRLGGHEPAHDT
jgi:CBS domain-containing protein